MSIQPLAVRIEGDLIRVVASDQIISGGGGGGVTDHGALTGLADDDHPQYLLAAAAAEFIRDTMGTALVAGTNITLTVNDAGDTITIAATGGGGSITTDTAWAAKGDLIAATGNDAASVVTVGTDGYALLANSNATNGVRYGSIIPGLYMPSTLLCPAMRQANSASVAPPAAGRISAIWVVIPRRCVIDRVEINCTTAQAGETLRLGLYDNVGGQPANLLADWGTVDVSTTGTKSITGLSATYDPGIYWLAAVAQGGTANARYWGVANAAGVNLVTWSSATSDATIAFNTTGTTTTGAFPATFPAVNSIAANSLFICPRMA